MVDVDIQQQDSFDQASVAGTVAGPKNPQMCQYPADGLSAQDLSVPSNWPP